LACTFASPCLSREPKAKVATIMAIVIMELHNSLK